MRRYVLIVVVLLGVGYLANLARLVLLQPDPILLSAAQAVQVNDQPGKLHVYLTMENGALPNRLLAVSSAEAEQTTLIGAKVGEIMLPAHSKPSLSGDGVYLELIGVNGPLEQGRLIPILLEFEPSGTTTTRALVGGPPDPHAMHKMQASNEQPLNDPNAVPEISIEVSKGAHDGWDVVLQTANFTFAPEVEDPIHVPGEGHGHLYLNGLKLQRVYSDQVTIGALSPGQYELEVTLNTNLHQEYLSENGPVSATATIVVE